MTLTLEWIAERLCMGAATHVASLLHRCQQKGPNSEANFVVTPIRAIGLTFLRHNIIVVL